MDEIGAIIEEYAALVNPKHKNNEKGGEKDSVTDVPVDAESFFDNPEKFFNG